MFEKEKDLKNEAYFFIIANGMSKDFSRWANSRHAQGKAIGTAHAECLEFMMSEPQPMSDPRPASDGGLIETLKSCNETQRQLIQLQEEKITRLTELLADKEAKNDTKRNLSPI